jgi:hypothetical protein
MSGSDFQIHFDFGQRTIYRDSSESQPHDSADDGGSGISYKAMNAFCREH